jgi:hypothetical protein
MQRNQLIISLGILLLAIIIGITVFVFSSGQDSTSTTQSTGEANETTQLRTLMPEDIGLTLVPARSGKALMMNISKLTGIKSVEYELTYLSKGDIPRGAIGNLPVKPGDTLLQQEIILGTCSNVCKYDEGVRDIRLVLKINKTDGTVYSVQTTTSIN